MEVIEGDFQWLAELPTDLDLLDLDDGTWRAREGEKLLVDAFRAVFGKGRGLAVATKVLQIKRPRLFPVLDRFVVEMLDPNVSSNATTKQRADTSRKLARAIRTQGRANIEVLRGIKSALAAEDDFDRPLVRILDAILWSSHPAARVQNARRAFEVRLEP